LYIGVDFHPHQQTVAWCDTGTGETGGVELKHDVEKVREFYSSFSGSAVVGIEASAKAGWFEKVLTDAGHQLFVGNPVLIRKRATSRHKNDRRDAELILDLLLKGEFPAIWRRPPESNRVIEIMGLRQSLVRQRTQVYNRLQALAHSIGMPKGRMRSVSMQAVLKAVPMDEADAIKREHLFLLAEQLNRQIDELGSWLKQEATRWGMWGGSQRSIRRSRALPVLTRARGPPPGGCVSVRSPRRGRRCSGTISDRRP
jgi:transposase